MSEKEHADVGVIVARFQVHELHESQKGLIQQVQANHNKVIIFLGLSPVRGTIRNPLDFEARKQMILADFPDINVLYINDRKNDAVWSQDLDSQIDNLIGPTATAMLYGGRDAFHSHYHGRWPVTDLGQTSYLSGTAIRKNIARSSTMNSPGFRAGAIWEAANQYPRLIPTVDIAVWNEDGTALLMAKKAQEPGWRFVGGFAQPTDNAEDCLEKNAIRELREETGLEVSDMHYLGSHLIADWRYAQEDDKIATILFETRYIFGHPAPKDDICELKWFPILGDDTEISQQIVSEHRSLLSILIERSRMMGVGGKV